MYEFIENSYATKHVTIYTHRRNSIITVILIVI